MKQVINGHTTPGWPSIEVEYHRPIELFIDSLEGYNYNKNSLKILWIKESEAVSNFKSQAIDNKDKFDAFITYDDDVLKNCKNSYLLPHGTAWVCDYNLGVKKFQVSHLTGHKNITTGHKLRQKIHYKQEKIVTAKDFYISQYGGVENFAGNKVLAGKKEPLFDSQFHICVENSQQKNYFTEKLIDCFVTKTIPIYFGAPNIDSFFEINGMLIVNNADEIIIACNSLTEEVYNNKIEYIEKNFELSQKYIAITDRLEYTINEILKTNN